MSAPAEPAAPDFVDPDIKVSPPGESSAEMGLLKRLLFRAEQTRLESMQHDIEAMAARVGDSQRFEAATADVLAGALRRAEIAGHRELSQAMAPLVVAAIRSEIVNSRDMMVEALYPITGRLVAASVSNAFRDLVERIESRLDALLSTQMWRLRLRALATGRPLAEILLEAAQRPQVRRLFVLERESGVLLASWSANGVETESAELVSGLIAAVSQFATQAFAHQQGELRTLDMGASRVLLRASARLIVAAELSGEPHAAEEARMDRALYALIEEFPEGPDAAGLGRIAAGFAAADAGSAVKTGKKRSPAGKILFAAAMMGLAIWVSLVPARHFWFEHKLNAAFARAAAEQNLGPWPLSLSIDHRAGLASISGLAPPNADIESISSKLRQAGTPYRVAANVMRVTTVESAAATEKRLADATTGAAAEAGASSASLAARIARQESWRDSQQAWRDSQEAVANTPQARLAALVRDSAVWFGEADDLLDPAAAQRIFTPLAELLKATGARLRVVGYSDANGAARINLALSQRRADSVVAALVGQGVDSQQLVAVGRGDEAAIAPASPQERRRNRRAVFELVGPAERGQ